MGRPASTSSLSFLNVPGLGGSGPDHWQTLWEGRYENFDRVEQADWENPVREQWVEALNHAIVKPGRPTILVAHSLGCHTVAWWAANIAQGYGRPVAGALLVAPPEVDRTDVHPILNRFAPLPVQPLPFPSIVVASRDDEYATIAESRRMARIWQSHFVDIGQRGHINAVSELGGWDEGWALVGRLVDAHDQFRSRQLLTGRLTPSLTIEINPTNQPWG